MGEHQKHSSHILKTKTGFGLVLIGQCESTMAVNCECKCCLRTSPSVDQCPLWSRADLTLCGYSSKSSMCLCYTDMLWSKASIPPPRCSWRAERLQWVCPCMRVERQRNVCLVGSIDIFPWAQEKATGNKGKQGFCRFMCLHVCVCLRVCEYVCELQY